MFQDIVGQDHIKERLNILVQDANDQGYRLPDLFFAGPGGTGKSTFARIVAENYGNKLYAEVNATSVKNMNQLLAHLFSSCGVEMIKDKGSRDVTLPQVTIFIDEAHKIKGDLETELLNATDSQRITTFKTSKGDVFTANFKNATFILATTNKADLPAPLLTRFQMIEMSPYTPQEIAQSMKLRTGWDIYTCLEIGKRAKSIMRTAVNDIPGIQAYLRVKGLEANIVNIIRYYNDIKKVDEIGLDVADYSILETLASSSKSLGVKAIKNRLGRPENEVEASLGFMATQGLVEKGSSGQTITDKGRSHLEKALVGIR